MSADFDSINSGIRKMGYLKKLKTMKKKFFILRTETSTSPPTLEYYDSEKKFRNQVGPKRVVNIRTCFNINKKLDTKQKHALALYTKDDCFAMVAENKEDQEDWLDALLELQQDAHPLDGEEKPKPAFEYVWQVTVKSKGLGSSQNILGSYRLCLTSKALSLMKMSSDIQDTLEFPLMSVRRCGHSNCFFFMELGRSALTGPGELWMQTEDTIIAQNMHEAILGAMRASTCKEEFGPLPRSRSSSATESSKPISVHPRRGTSSNAPNRERSDSMPTRSRTVSEGEKNLSRMSAVSPSASDKLRPQSMYNRNLSYSPPTGINYPLSPGSGPCSTDSAGSSQSIDENECSFTDSHFMRFTHQRSLTPENPIHEPSIREEIDDYVPHSPLRPDLSTSSSLPKDGYMEMSPGASVFPPLQLRSPSTPNSKPNYLDMSPLGTPLSGLEESGYLPMSPIGRYSSFAEAASILPGQKIKEPPEPYVEMKCLTEQQQQQVTEIDGYFDMTPTSQTSGANKDRDDSSYLSMSPSLTPTPDFSEFHLDKVQSYLTEDDDKRPIRAYSVGSRPTKLRKELMSDTERVRAYSVGSRMAITLGKRYDNLGMNLDSTPEGKEEAKKMSNSAPHLGDPSGNSGYSTPPSRVLRAQYSKMNRSEDLMEIDYNNPIVSSLDSVKTSQDSLKKSLENVQKVSSESISGKRSRSNSKSMSSKQQAGGDYLEMSIGSKDAKKPEINKQMKKSDSRELKKADSKELKKTDSQETKVHVPVMNKELKKADSQDGKGHFLEMKAEVKNEMGTIPVKTRTPPPFDIEPKKIMPDYMEMKIGSVASKDQGPPSNELQEKKTYKEKGKNLKVTIDKKKNESSDTTSKNTNLNTRQGHLDPIRTSKETSPGEYVNIDFKNSPRSSVLDSHVVSEVSSPALSKSPTKASVISPDYMNITIHKKVGLSSMSCMSDYTVMAPVATTALPGKLSSSNRAGLLSSLGKSHTLPSDGNKKVSKTHKGESRPKSPSSSISAIGSLNSASSCSKLYSTLPAGIKMSPSGPPQSPVMKTPSSPSHITKTAKADVDQKRTSSSPLMDRSAIECSANSPPPSVSQRIPSPNPTSGSPQRALDLKSKLVNLVKPCKKYNPSSLTKDVPEGLSSGPNSPAILSEKSDSPNVFGLSDLRNLNEAPYENITIGHSASRHSSGSSTERELNYASLDLALNEDDDKCPRSPRTSKGSHDSNVFEDVDSGLSYAEIDFNKSEALRNTSSTMRESRF